MLYSKNQDGYRISPEPEKVGFCPLCDGEMIPKCGDIKIWHWAHKSACPYDYEIETEWHRDWKGCFPEDWAEITIEKHAKKYRADVKTDYQMVIEFQHSSISNDDIFKREIAYDFMVWIFDCLEAWEGNRLIECGYKPDFLEFKWTNPRRIFTCKKPIYLHIKENLLIQVVGLAKKHYENDIPAICFKGSFIQKDKLIKKLLNPPKNLRVVCPYKDKSRLVNYHVCLWHRKENDPECFKSYWPWKEFDKCQQWKYPFLRTLFNERQNELRGQGV